MMSLDQVALQFPDHLRLQRQAMLREYLQCLILEIVFESKLSQKLCFLGGTCLSLVHGNTRFSEDLDFDNFGLSDPEFDEIALVITKGLEKLGFSVQVNCTHKGAYRCNIRFPGLLFNQSLSNDPEAKILIQLDTEEQGFGFKPEIHFLNRFGVFARILTTPKDILLAQKLYTIINRPRSKGRDFFDVVHLFSLGAKPDYNYLEQKMSAGTPRKLKIAIEKHLDITDLELMASDVRPFLFQPEDDKRVKYFKEFWNGLVLE
jgi:predicted nucleotidyltransferase component of viral defense system